MPKLRAALLFVCLLAVPLAACAADFKAKVIGVADGDTVTVLQAKKPVKIRLNGIDCPEKRQAFGTKAKKVTSELCFGRMVTVRPKETDRYGRTVADIVLPDGRVLNQELVKAGMAWWYQQYSKDVGLKKLEEEARKAKRGLWADKKPVAPWEWRRRQRAQRSKRRGGKDKTEAAASKPDEAGDPVYVTATGKKYHLRTCRYAKRAKKITRADAKKRGYEPCKVCKPPE